MATKIGVLFLLSCFIYLPWPTEAKNVDTSLLLQEMAKLRTENEHYKKLVAELRRTNTAPRFTIMVAGGRSDTGALFFRRAVRLGQPEMGVWSGVARSTRRTCWGTASTRRRPEPSDSCRWLRREDV